MTQKMTRRKSTTRLADAILTADIHLRDTTPVCRTDDYWLAQWGKIRFLRELQNAHHCPILDAGDLMDTWKASAYLLNHAIQKLPGHIITIPGNHEMPSHNMALLEKSGLAVLQSAGKVTILDPDHSITNIGIGEDITVVGFGYGQPIRSFTPSISSRRTVLLVHDMFYASPGTVNPYAPGGIASKLIDKMKVDLVVSGHNHQPFVLNNGKSLWVNPGSLMRMDADQIDYKPRVYLWFADDNTIEEVPVPIQTGVISCEHLDKKEEKDQRMEAFVRRMRDDYDISLSYERNLESHFKANNTRKPVQDIIMEELHG